MSKVYVYQFKCFNVNNNEEEYSDKFATLESIKRIKCTPIEESKIQIDTNELNDSDFYIPTTL